MEKVSHVQQGTLDRTHSSSTTEEVSTSVQLSLSNLWKKFGVVTTLLAAAGCSDDDSSLAGSYQSLQARAVAESKDTDLDTFSLAEVQAIDEFLRRHQTELAKKILTHIDPECVSLNTRIFLIDKPEHMDGLGRLVVIVTIKWSRREVGEGEIGGSFSIEKDGAGVTKIGDIDMKGHIRKNLGEEKQPLVILCDEKQEKESELAKRILSELEEVFCSRDS